MGAIIAVQLLSIGFTFALASVYSKQPEAPARVPLRIAGAGTLVGPGGVARDWAIEIEKLDSEVRVDLDPVGNAGGLNALLNERADIAISTRPASADEIRLARDRGYDLTSPDCEHRFGFDGLAVVVNRDNPIEQLTIEQLRRIFDGSATVWPTVAGARAYEDEIRRYVPAEHSGVMERFRETVLGTSAASTSGDLQVPDDWQLCDNVARDRGAIAVVPFSAISGGKALKIAVTDNAEAIEPSGITIRNGSYPLASSLYLFTRAAPQGHAKDFVEYATRRDGRGQALLPLHNLVGLKTRLITVSERNGGRFYDAYIRFESSGIAMIRDSRDDLEEIAIDLRSQTKSVYVELQGYTDSEGGVAHNESLSIFRAEAVRLVLEKSCPGLEMRLVSKRDTSPRGDNSTPEGRAMNRRVEIWVYPKEGELLSRKP